MAPDGRALRLEWTTYPSPVGPLTLVEGEDGPLVVHFGERTHDVRWQLHLRGTLPEVRAVKGPCATTRAFLDAYFAGRRTPRVPVDHLADYMDLPDDQLAVLRQLVRIPFGETRTYGELAQGLSLHARHVGQLVGRNPLGVLVPCHRVVGARGALVGFGGGLPAKRWLLNHELRVAGLTLTPAQSG